LNWIVVSRQDKISANVVSFTGERKNHILSILKKQIGDTLRVLIPNLHKGIYKITDINSECILCIPIELEETRELHSLSQIELFFALPRPQTGKKILHLAGAYGIGKIHFIFPHSKNKEYKTSPLYLGGETDELLGGMSQSGNLFLPEINYLYSMSEFLHLVKSAKTIVFDPTGAPYSSMKNRLLEWDPSSFRLQFVFGPESGFLPTELEFFQEKNIPIISLGNIILRTEYAFHGFLHETRQILETKST